MTSPYFVTARRSYDDDGAVHDNDGVGNKTAYLISQGGTFNGQTITGIDGGDAGLAKTGRLYLEMIPRLTSGAEYADLGRVLVSTCDELCRPTAPAASRLSRLRRRCAPPWPRPSWRSPPTDAAAASAEVAVDRARQRPRSTPLARDDDDASTTSRFTLELALWQRTPGRRRPDVRRPSGEQLAVRLRPGSRPRRPGVGEPLTSRPRFTVPAPSAATVPALPPRLRLRRDFDGGASTTTAARCSCRRWSTAPGSTATGLPWVNGPNRHIVGSTTAGFPASAATATATARARSTSPRWPGRRSRVVFRVER